MVSSCPVTIKHDGVFKLNPQAQIYANETNQWPSYTVTMKVTILGGNQLVFQDMTSLSS